MSLSTLEAYDLIRFAEAFEARLAAADELLSGREGLEPEKSWLATAIQLVGAERKPASALLARVKDLPELEEAREEFATEQQNLWVDALEKLHAGITFCASSRSPVIDALFPHLKFPQLRRAPRESLTEYAASYERRLKSSYVTRILANDEFAFVRPVLEQVSQAYASWLASLEPVSLPEEQAQPLREELVALGKRLDAAIRQARLLSEAAFVPIPGAFEATGLAAKPRRRPGRGLPVEAEGLDAGDGEEVGSPSSDVSEEGAPEEPSSEASVEEVAPLAPAPAAEAPSESAEAQPVSETVSSETSAEQEPAPKPARRGRKKAAPKVSTPASDSE